MITHYPTETGKLNIESQGWKVERSAGMRKSRDPKKIEETTSFLFIDLTNLVLIELLYSNPGL
jgi:hypothetical protein